MPSNPQQAWTRARGARYQTVFFLLVLWLQACDQAQPADDPAKLSWDKVEEVTTYFSKTLCDLATSLKDRGGSGLQDFFTPTVTGSPFPIEPGERAPEGALLERRVWKAKPVTGSMALDELVASTDAFLSHFPQVDDIVLEMASSTIQSETSIEAPVDIAIYARNREGQREWVRGQATVGATLKDKEWRIHSFRVGELESMISIRDIFTDVTEAAGVAHTDLPLLGAMGKNQQWYPNAAAAADVDRDGLVDLLVTGPEENYLYLNRGDGTFSDASGPAGLKSILPGKAELNPVFFDFDNDGDLDLFITSVHENVLLENLLVPSTRLLFRNRSLGLPQLPEVQSWSVAVADVNGDSFPDLYATSYFSPMKGPHPRTTIGDVDGRRNLLFINQKDGTFTEAAESWGVADTRFGLAAQFVDIDGDHDQDLYVTNDFGGGNCLYINQGDRFVDEARQRGVVLDAQSMGVSFADYDNDGDFDLHVTNMSSKAGNRILASFKGKKLEKEELLSKQWTGNALLENQGDGTFRDVSAKAGPFYAEWAWGGGFIDIDNDGWQDLHTANGFLSGKTRYDGRGLVFSRFIASLQQEDVDKANGLAFQGQMMMGQLVQLGGYSIGGWTHDRVYLNRADGKFLEISGVAGVDTFPSDARSTVYADFDNDGDQDIFVRAIHGRAHFLFRNDIGQDRPFLRVELVGAASGRDAFGAVVRVKTASATYTKAKLGSNGYLAQSDPRLLFGLGEPGSAVEWLEVQWPSGLVQRFDAPLPGSSLRITEGRDEPQAVEEKRFRLGD